MWRYATPFGLTSEYAHPAEILFLGFATIVGPAVTGPHLITLWLWMVLRVLETVEAHCGYHFPWSPSNFFPLYGGWVSCSFSVTWQLTSFFWFIQLLWLLLLNLASSLSELIFTTIITDCCIPSLETTHQRLLIWTGKFSIFLMDFLLLLLFFGYV